MIPGTVSGVTRRAHIALNCVPHKGEQQLLVLRSNPSHTKVCFVMGLPVRRGDHLLLGPGTRVWIAVAGSISVSDATCRRRCTIPRIDSDRLGQAPTWLLGLILNLWLLGLVILNHRAWK